MLHAKIVYLTKNKTNNTLQLQTTISFKMQHIKFELHIKLFNASHASLLFENTTPSKHNYIQTFSVRLHKNDNLNNTLRSFMEAKSSAIITFRSFVPFYSHQS